MNRLFLIDGSSLLSTSFFGNLHPSYLKSGDTTKLMQTSEGVFTNGVFTMTRILLNLFKTYKPSHFAVAWDVSRETFRRERYEPYKAHRKELRPELGSQFSLMQEVLEQMNIPQFKLDRYEADDIIGTFAKKFEANLPVIIMTKDQDALQLVSHHTRVWLNTSKSKEYVRDFGIEPRMYHVPDGFFEYTPLTLQHVYHLSPSQIVDMKALLGDTSDNIPGVKGVGEKAVIPLLQEFGTVEHLYDFIEDMTSTEVDEFKLLLRSLGISRSPLAYLLKESDEELVGKQAAFLSKELATIKTDIDAFDKLELSQLELNCDWSQTRSIFQKLEFHTLLDKVGEERAG